MSVTVTLTALLFVTSFVYVVSFTLVQPFGVCNALLHVNVKTNDPFVHDASVIVHVGATVSIPLNVTSTSAVLPSLSSIVIVHLSLHSFPLFGVYVNVVPFIAQLHFVPFVFTHPKLKSLVPQLHSLAFDAARNCANVILLDPLLIHHVLNALAVGDTSLNVYVAVLFASFHTPSFTYHTTFTLHGCCALTV